MSQLVEEVVHFTSLDGNLLGDPSDRRVIIYLPPSYETDLLKRYPVVYLLHGGMTDNLIWSGKSFNNYFGDFNLKVLLDDLLSQNKISEMITVMPDSNTTFMGNWYVNSKVLGNYDDYIAQELVDYIDKNYRTLAQRESRGIGGHSLGGFGAINLATHHPEVFSACYGHESSALRFEEFGPFNRANQIAYDVFANRDWDTFNKANPSFKINFLTPATFSPDINAPPFYGTWLWTKDKDSFKLNESVWKQWKAFDPSNLVEHRKDKLLRLSAIKFDGATKSGTIPGANIFQEELKKAGISHEFETFDGGHFDCIVPRMEFGILPFFSEVLASN